MEINSQFEFFIQEVERTFLLCLLLNFPHAAILNFYDVIYMVASIVNNQLLLYATIKIIT